MVSPDDVSAPRPGDVIALDLALGIVAAEDADARRARDTVGVNLSHRHLRHVDPAEARLADVIVLDHHHRRVGDDSLLTASNDATLDHTHAPMQREGDVDALGELSLRRLDRAVGDADVAAPHVDPVHRRIAHLNAVQEDVMGLVDVDPVLATLDRDAANDDMVGADDDPAANDGPGLADERLRPIEQERPLMDTCGEVDPLAGALPSRLPRRQRMRRQ